MLINEGMKSFIEKVDSLEPVPGGGSVSALVGVLGVSLGRMYQHLTFNKKSYLNKTPAEQTAFKAVFTELEVIKERLLILVDRDAAAYNTVLEAYRLPKNDETEIEKRNAAILSATLLAIDAPLTIMKEALAGLKLLEIIVGQGNKNAVSDVGVGAILLEGAVQGAFLNVKINLPQLAIAQQESLLAEVNGLLEAAAQLKERIMAQVNEEL